MLELRTVFIVDDDEAVRHSLSRLFESFDFDVHSFDSAGEFLEFFDARCAKCPSRGTCQECNGCLILDLFMPDMNGLELLQRLAGKSKRIPTIMISGHADEDVEAEAKRAGVNAFLHKPFVNADLMEAIDSLFGDELNRQPAAN